MTFIANTKFGIEVARGNVPGWAGVVVVAQSTLINTTFSDIWDVGGLLTIPSSAETLEIISSNTNDTSAGTGARSVAVITLDASFETQVTIVTLNGTTAVTLSNTHRFFQSAAIITAGSGEVNEGDLTIRILSAGATRGKIPLGEGLTHNSQFMVPLGKTLFPNTLNYFAEKNEDILFRPQFIPFGANTVRLSAATIPMYQNNQQDVFEATAGFGEKLIVLTQGKSELNSNITGTFIANYYLVDD